MHPMSDGTENDIRDQPIPDQAGEGFSPFAIDGDAAAGGVAGAAGMEVIRQFWTALPSTSGVYRMIDAAGEVLYVGKARNLKNRVGSYARGQAHSNRIARMISDTAHMEFVTTGTEAEALLLEANLIKQLRPRYNVLLRDDKSLPYILVTEDERGPQLTKHRGARNRKGAYFGPFASVWAVNRTMTALQRAFLLRTCSDSYFDNRTRPCLLFQIKRCSGPCTGEISKEDYAAMAAEARDFLAGKSSKVKERLAADMQAASEEMEFERAARYRDRLAALSAIQSSQGINTQSVEQADVIAIAEQGGQFCVEVFFFRNWQNWGNRAYFPKADKSLSTEEVLTSFIVQFYSDKPPPKQVLLSQEIGEAALVATALGVRAGHKVEVLAPRRGERRQIVENAQRNAKEALGRRQADTASQQRLLDLLADAFSLERSPRRVEVYDNSHIMGTNAVGAMIVAGAGGFMKTHYRTFNMPADKITPGDDFGMMREMLRRRFARLLKENPRVAEADAPTEDPEWEDDASDEFPAWPDLVLIDGGEGQVKGVRAIMNEIGVEGVPVIGIAKGQDRDAGRETFFVEGKPPFRLPPRDPVLYFVQRLRDEAHRFAIGTHRAKRKRDIRKNPLDEVAGIGPSRKRALLHHFGTVKAIQRASLEDLMRTPGVNAATARAVHDFFHDGGG
jgi:excinuclease ABC subunit C